MIESLSCIWSETQEFVALHDKNLLSSFHSCPCHELHLLPKVRQNESCPQFEALEITFIANSAVIESLSCIWEYAQAFIALHDKNLLSSCHSWHCPKFWLQSKVKQNGNYLSPVWSLRNHIHWKMFCDRIIVVHLIRDSSICSTAWQKPVEQLSLLSLSWIAFAAAQDKAKWKLSPVWSPRNHIHCKQCQAGIIVMHLTTCSGICFSVWWRPIEPLSLLSLSKVLVAVEGEAKWQLLVPSLKPKESHS